MSPISWTGLIKEPSTVILRFFKMIFHPLSDLITFTLKKTKQRKLFVPQKLSYTGIWKARISIDVFSSILISKK